MFTAPRFYTHGEFPLGVAASFINSANKLGAWPLSFKGIDRRGGDCVLLKDG